MHLPKCKCCRIGFVQNIHLKKLKILLFIYSFFLNTVVWPMNTFKLLSNSAYFVSALNSFAVEDVVPQIHECIGSYIAVVTYAYCMCFWIFIAHTHFGTPITFDEAVEFVPRISNPHFIKNYMLRFPARYIHLLSNRC